MSDRRLPPWLELGLATFGILALELAVIRFMSQQIRIFAYLNNLLLIGAFLGMGLGVGAGRKRPWLVHLTLPALLTLVFLLRYAGGLGLARLSFPDISIAMWGAEGVRQGETFASTLALILGLFGLVVSVFLFAGAIVGDLFGRMQPLRAYSADLLGSLLGVLAMTLLSSLHTSPPWWFALGAFAFVIVSRKWWSIVSFAGVIVLTWLAIEGARFSPYNRLDLGRNMQWPGKPLILAANRDFHQYMHDLGPRQDSSRMLEWIRYHYDLPFRIAANKKSALVVGAGTGNDVAAGLRAGFERVVSVDIDPVIIDIGRKYHPERPYSSPRVEPVVQDARAYFERHPEEKFDVVCFGLLDSHAMFSAMSTLRLDNFVYTREGLRAAWDHVAPGGLMSVSFNVYSGAWISDRIHKTIAEATGQEPVVVDLPAMESRVFIVGRDVDMTALRAGLPAVIDRHPDEHTRITTDDWPFLYLRPGAVPTGYLAVLSSVLVLAIVATRLVFGRGLFQGGGFDVPLFLLGAGFLLIETRGVTDLSLLFGSTWLVNSAVFGGILFVVWLANLWVLRKQPANVALVFVPLVLSLLLSWAIRPGALLEVPLPLAGTLGGILNALPIGFAGIVFSTLLSRSSDPAASLGSNLLGAVVGGVLEYLSIITGLRALTLLAMALYLTALLVLLRRKNQAQPIA